MRFHSFDFLVFFIVVLAMYWALPRRGQNLLLLAASYVFYGWIHPWFCALIAFSTVLDFACGLAMGASGDAAGDAPGASTVPAARRRRALILSLVGNLGMLGVFKYYDFFVLNVQDVLETVGLGVSLPVLSVMLPVGISFYTFQTLSYTLDIHAGRLAPRKSFLDFAVFVAMFPQLVAGPIERARRLLPQIERDRSITTADFEWGLRLAIWGYFKKLVIADNVVIYADRIFELELPSGPLLVAGALAFAVQILADFSAYTDIARGIARMLGFDLMENFRAPYLASSPSDFWRRWHISFSSWIRDYLYIPLGGSRGSRSRFVFAVMVAMSLSGLWHGASWNFVLWGVFHGLLVVIYHLGFRALGERLGSSLGEGTARALGVCVMFPLTLLGWLIFRQQDGDRLFSYVRSDLFVATPEEWSVALGVTALMVALSLPMLLRPLLERLAAPTVFTRAAVTWLWIVGILYLGREGGEDFIYFAF